MSIFQFSSVLYHLKKKISDDTMEDLPKWEYEKKVGSFLIALLIKITMSDICISPPGRFPFNILTLDVCICISLATYLFPHSFHFVLRSVVTYSEIYYKIFVTKEKWACVPLMKSKYNEAHQVFVTVMDELHQRCLRTSAHASHLRIKCASTLSLEHTHYLCGGRST